MNRRNPPEPRVGSRRGLLVATIGVLWALWGWGCADEPSRVEIPCAVSGDCRVAGAVGQLCVDGFCVTCSANTDCATDDAFGVGATCNVDGVCERCAPGFIGCSCFAGDACATGDCVDGVCVACDAGTVDCVCLGNGGCDAGLTCADPGVCRPCSPGAPDCPCRADDSCEGELTCVEGLCADVDCVPGEEGCPCRDERCLGGLVCGGDSICRPCTNEIEGCPCLEGLCRRGLVCEERTDTCESPLTCDDVGCLPFQRCEPSSPGVNAACLAECAPGYQWTGTRCEETVANCTFGVPGSIAGACAAEGRRCVPSESSATCGACLPGFLEEETRCRPVRDCDVLDCGERNRSCTASTLASDAFCGGCQPGFREIAGLCVRVRETTCEPGFETSIDLTCADNNRQCLPAEGGATCGECLTGFVPSPADSSVCVPRITCGDIDCGALGRNCSGGTVAACTDCIAGFVPVVGDPDRCRALRSCADLACAEGQRCVERDIDAALDAVCVDTQCVGRNETFDLFNQRCIRCDFCESVGGGTGRVSPISDRNGNCVCETQEGFFFDPAVSVRSPVACDEDGDGFVRITARRFLEMREGLPGDDPALRENARCSLRTIDRVRLINELGQELTVPLTDPLLGLGDEFSVVGLYETVRNDSPLEASRPGDLPVYGQRRLRAAELNTFAKACVTGRADFNDNGISDLAEHPNAGLSPQNTWMAPFLKLSFYSELHRSWYEAPDDGRAHGTFVIEERSRCELERANFDALAPRFPDGTDPYWRGCVLRRDARFRLPADPAASPTSVGTDLAAWLDPITAGNVCDPRSGSCPLPAPNRGAPFDDNGVPVRNYCDLGESVADLPWRGMNLHSLFQCAEVYTGAPAEVPAWPWYTDRQLWTGTGSGEGAPVLNQCRAVVCEPGEICQEGVRYGRSERNPLSPILRCDANPATTLQGNLDGRVGWVALRYRNAGASGYTRGCVDEGLEYISLCPGYDARDEIENATTGGRVYVGGIRAFSIPSQFGSVRCGCGFNFGGANCDLGCLGGNTFYGGDASGPVCDQGYCSIADGGGREGTWVCSEPAGTAHISSSAPRFVGTVNVGGTSTAVRLTGHVPASGIVRDFMYFGSGSPCTGEGDDASGCTADETCVYGRCVDRARAFTIR